MGIIAELKWIKAGITLFYQQYVSPLNPSGYGKIGKHSIIKNDSSLVKHNIFVDDWVVIQDHINFISNEGKLIVRKYSVISSGCTIVPGAHKLTVGVPFYLSTTHHINDEEDDIIINEDCWIGAGCILLPGCQIGRGAVVAAGSVVKKEVPPYAVVAGVPARIIATKFTAEQILKHETSLYPENERFSKDYIIDLFDQKYKGLNSIGTDELPAEMKQNLQTLKRELGIIDYSGI